MATEGRLDAFGRRVVCHCHKMDVVDDELAYVSNFGDIVDVSCAQALVLGQVLAKMGWSRLERPTQDEHQVTFQQMLGLSSNPHVNEKVVRSFFMANEKRAQLELEMIELAGITRYDSSKAESLVALDIVHAHLLPCEFLISMLDTRGDDTM